MSRYQTLTYVTGSIAAGASSVAGDTDKAMTGSPNLVNIVKTKIIPDAAGGSFDVRIYKDAAQTALLAYYPAVAPNLYDPMDNSSGTPAEALEGPPLPFEDTDASGKMHLKITNNDGISHTYTVTMEYEEVPTMTSAGGATFRSSMGIGGTPAKILDIFGAATTPVPARFRVNNASGGGIEIYDTANSVVRGYCGYGTNLFVIPAGNIDDVGILSVGGIAFSVSSGVTALQIDKTSKLFSLYGSVVTAGWGVPAVYAAGRSAAAIAAVASVSTYTVGAADGTFEVSANVLVTTATTHAFTVTCAYTDEGNTSRTLTMMFTLVAGGTLVTSIANGNGTVPYMGIPQHIRCKAATTITIATTGTFTTVVYNVEGIIKQTA